MIRFAVVIHCFTACFNIKSSRGLFVVNCINQNNRWTCIRHIGSFNGEDGFPYIGERGRVAGKFSVALDRRKDSVGKPLNQANYQFTPVSLRELADYAKNRERFPYLRVRCKPDQIGAKGNAGRFLREMVIDWEALDRCVIGA